MGQPRLTPAGLAALDLQLAHESQQSEAGQPRSVKATVRALALGTVAETLARQALGSNWLFSGFLTSPRNSRQLVFHIQDFHRN
jgi:primosomal replication protein N